MRCPLSFAVVGEWAVCGCFAHDLSTMVLIVVVVVPSAVMPTRVMIAPSEGHNYAAPER